MGRKTLPPTNDNTDTVRELALREARTPSSQSVHIQKGLRLDCGAMLPELVMAYEQYGELNEERTNAILVCQALTGDQYAASQHPVTGKPGWWLTMIGPGKALDTDRYCVICPNVLGSCLGSTGPLSINPDTGRAYGLDLPVITLSLIHI